jgi:hypothetical protein
MSDGNTTFPAVVITEDAGDLRLILHDDVEAVVWHRKLTSATRNAIAKAAESFNPATVDPAQQAARMEDIVDKDRVLVAEDDPEYQKTMKAIWKERALLKRTIEKHLPGKGKTVVVELMVQKPVRQGAMDNAFHQDLAVGKKRKHPIVFATMTHVGKGTELIPTKDAGQLTPYSPDSRAIYRRPKTLEHLFRAAVADIVFVKTGPKGGVHRTPQVRPGEKRSNELRFWSWLMKETRISDIRATIGEEKLQHEFKKRSKKYLELNG